ncbi:MAG: Cytoplasmic thioredoxin isoenzyme 2 [Thelocarpon superellum]|nr:MAG: Cytoplasmic thioredoxin isoenzyme 2 [Thelocarpon superellum]
MGVHNLSSKKEFEEAQSQSGVMVVDCFATWCGPCKVIAPKLVAFSEVYTNARFYKVDVDEVPEVASLLEVRAMPTFVIFKDGTKAGTVVGASPDALEKAIKEAL